MGGISVLGCGWGPWGGGCVGVVVLETVVLPAVAEVLANCSGRIVSPLVIGDVKPLVGCVGPLCEVEGLIRCAGVLEGCNPLLPPSWCFFL